MRGGPYAERRVIDLINRRFVPFFYNIGEGSPGYDADAEAWFKKHKLSHVYSGVFTAEGNMLEKLPNDGDKHRYFDALREALDDNPDYDIYSKEEKALIGTESDEVSDATARLHEELGNYETALELYTQVDTDRARLSIARILRYQKKWADAAETLNELKEAKELSAEIAVERAYALLDKKEYEKARVLLTDTAKAHPQSSVIGELHYYAGIASYYLERKDWANFHWYYIVENLSEDRHYQRAWLSVAIEAIPFPFAELPGEGMSGGTVTHDSSGKARKAAKEDYESLAEIWPKDDYWDATTKPDSGETPESSGEEEDDF